MLILDCPLEAGADAIALNPKGNSVLLLVINNGSLEAVRNPSRAKPLKGIVQQLHQTSSINLPLTVFSLVSR